jgi:hypothetical protein
MRLKRQVYDQICQLITDGKDSLPAVQEAFPHIPEKVIKGVYHRKAHHDARHSLRSISNLRLRIDYLYMQYPQNYWVG